MAEGLWMIGGISVKKKMILTLAFLVSLLPKLLNQYGGRKGVQEISGLINLCFPGILYWTDNIRGYGGDLFFH